MSQINQIRVDEVDGGVSHYSTKYYSVVHNSETITDELVINDNKKVVGQVVALNQVGNTINYKEIESDNV